MVKVRDGVVQARNGIVEVEVKDGYLLAHPKTEEQAREIVLDFVKLLENDIEVSQAILTGSYARGCPGEWDEIDVLIISPDFAGMANRLDRMGFLGKRAMKVHSWLLPRGGYTQEEYGDCVGEPGLSYYKATGKVVYDKGDG